MAHHHQQQQQYHSSSSSSSNPGTGLYGAYDNTFQNHSELGYDDGFSPAPYTPAPYDAATDSFRTPAGAAMTLAPPPQQQQQQQQRGGGPNSSNIQYASDYNPNNFYVEQQQYQQQQLVQQPSPQMYPSPSHNHRQAIQEPSSKDYGGFGFRRGLSGLGGVGGSGDAPSPGGNAHTQAHTHHHGYPGGTVNTYSQSPAGANAGGMYGYQGASGYQYGAPSHLYQPGVGSEGSSSNIVYESSMAAKRFTDPRVVRLQNSLRDKDLKLQELLRKMRKTQDKLTQATAEAESSSLAPTKIDRLKAKLDTDAEREQQLAASVKELKRAERENAREIAALEKAQREWPSKIHQMTMGLRVKEDEVHKMVLRADATERKHEARQSTITDLKVRFSTLTEKLRDLGHDDVFQEIEDRKHAQKQMWEERFREYEQKIKTLQKFKEDQKRAAHQEIGAEASKGAELATEVEMHREQLSVFERDLRVKLLHIKKLKGGLEDIAESGRTKLDLRPIERLFRPRTGKTSADDASGSVQTTTCKDETSDGSDENEDGADTGSTDDEDDDENDGSDSGNSAAVSAPRSPQKRRPMPLLDEAAAAAARSHRSKDDMSIPSPNSRLLTSGTSSMTIHTAKVSGVGQDEDGSRGHIGRLIAQKALRSSGTPSPRARRSPRYQPPETPDPAGSSQWGSGTGQNCHDGIVPDSDARVAPVKSPSSGIGFNEFASIAPESASEEQLRRIFVRFDVDGDGVLTNEQFDRAIFFFRGADSLGETSPSVSASRTIEADMNDDSSDSVDNSEDSLDELEDGEDEDSQRNAHNVAPVSLDDDEADLLRNIRGEFDSPAGNEKEPVPAASPKIFTEPMSRRASRDGDELLGISVDEDDDPEEKPSVQHVARLHPQKANSNAAEANGRIDVPSSEVFENAADDFLAVMRNRSAPTRQEDDDGGDASSEAAITTNDDSPSAKGVLENMRASPSQRDESTVTVAENESKTEEFVETSASSATRHGSVPQSEPGGLDGDPQPNRGEDATLKLGCETTSLHTVSGADTDPLKPRDEAHDLNELDAARGSDANVTIVEGLPSQQGQQRKENTPSAHGEHLANNLPEEPSSEVVEVDPIEQLKVAFDAVDLDRDGYIEQCEFTDLIRGLWLSSQQRNSLPNDYDAAEKAARRGYAALERSEDMMLRFSDVIRWFEEHFEAPDQTMDGPESSKLKEQRKLTTAPRNMQVAIEESLDTSDTPAMQPMTKSADSRDNNQSACDLSHDELDLQLALRTNATDNAPLASRSGAYADALAEIRDVAVTANASLTTDADSCSSFGQGKMVQHAEQVQDKTAPDDKNVQDQKRQNQEKNEESLQVDSQIVAPQQQQQQQQQRDTDSADKRRVTQDRAKNAMEAARAAVAAAEVVEGSSSQVSQVQSNESSPTGKRNPLAAARAAAAAAAAYLGADSIQHEPNGEQDQETHETAPLATKSKAYGAALESVRAKGIDT